MRIHADGLSYPAFDEPRVGNVYPVRGGRGMKDGNLMVLLALTEPREYGNGNLALMLIISKEGKPRGVTHYGRHYIEELCPIAFVEGLDDLDLTMRSL